MIGLCSELIVALHNPVTRYVGEKGSLLITACPSRNTGAVAPLMIQAASGQTVLYMVDGSGSWGPGIEAAAWFRDWLASAHKNDNTISTTDVTTALRAGIEQLPSVVIDDDFHWTFSIVAVIADDTTIRMGACGAFAAAAVSRSLIDRLLTPARPIDELVTRGHVSESEAECHKHSNMLSGPFFGVDGQDDLIWIPPIENPPETQVIIGDSGLQRYLESQRSHELQTDPVAIRDAVEQFCGRSAPTAVLSAS